MTQTNIHYTAKEVYWNLFHEWESQQIYHITSDFPRGSV